MTTIVHYVTTTADHTRTTTLCGLTLTTDHAHVARVVSNPTGWTTCPLCETAAELDGLTAFTDDTPPRDPPRPHYWTQPDIYDLLREDNDQ